MDENTVALIAWLGVLIFGAVLFIAMMYFSTKD